jgi:FixJ family two-component response regulator
MNRQIESANNRERPNQSLFGRPTRSERGSSQLQSGVVAVVEDDCSVRRAIGRLIKSAGLPVETFGSAEEFLQASLGQESSCLVLDLQLPGMDGLALQNRLSADHRSVPVIVVSAHCDTQTRSQALQAGACAFFGKPFDDEALINTIQSALNK